MKFGAVAVLLKDKKVLAVSRKHDHTDFGLPGGKVDAGETFEDAVRRELLEETGIKAGEMSKIWTRSDDTSLVHVFMIYDWEGEPTQMEEGKVEWVDWSVIEKGSFGKFNTKLREVLISYFDEISKNLPR